MITNSSLHWVQDVHSEESRIALGHMIVLLFNHWQLQPVQQSQLLGLSQNSRSTLARLRKGGALPNNIDLLQRVGHLLAIHKCLRTIFPHNRDLVYRWVTVPNRGFADRKPIEIMCEDGYLGIVAVRRYLDFERGH